MRRSACHATTAVRRPADRAPSGQGSTVCKSRYIAAAIAIRRQAKAAQRTPEQAAELAAILAGLVARCGADIGRARRGEALITAGDANPRASAASPVAVALPMSLVPPVTCTYLPAPDRR